MIDLTSIIDGILSEADVHWTRASMDRHLGDLVAMLNGRSNWDEEAGEQWAPIARGNEVAAYLFIRWPFAVVVRNFIDESSEIDGLKIVRVSSMDAEVLTCDEDRLREFCNVESFSSDFNPSLFSFHDLYFETVL